MTATWLKEHERLVRDRGCIVRVRLEADAIQATQLKLPKKPSMARMRGYNE